MKKSLLFFTILLVVSSIAFASSDLNLKVNLDLTVEPIEFFGVTSTAPNITTYASAKELNLAAMQSISITPTANDPTQTSPASFYVWWYIYSPHQYNIYINFNPLTSTDGVKIPFDITTEGEGGSLITYSSSEEAAAYADSNRIADLSATELITGSKALNVPAFNRLDLTVKNSYTSTIKIEIKTT